MTHVTAFTRVSYVLLALLGLLFPPGCAPKTVTNQLDLVGAVQNKQLARQELDNIAYQAREYAENHVRSNFSQDMESYQDRLAYWVNAEMVDICGIITVEEKLPNNDKQSTQSSAPENISVQALIVYQSFAEAANTMQLRTVYAELVYKDERWEVKSAQEQTDESPAIDLTLDNHDVYWLSFF